MSYLLLASAVVVGFIFSFIQTRQLIQRGSDHIVHLFLARVIRENRHRLFVKVPHLINEAHCSALPLFMHWMLSFFTDRQIQRISPYINSLAHCSMIVLTFAAASLNIETLPIAGWASLIVALTPQFFHAYNARNYGISARPIGLLLFTILCFGIIYSEGKPIHNPIWLCLLVTGYLIWGFNTFAQQSLVLISLVIGFYFGDWKMGVLTLSSMALFLILHPAYGFHYLKYTFLFIKAYATDVAAVFINKQRHSIWRDFVWDIWIAIRRNPVSGLVYAYRNPALIVGFLNPAAVLSMASFINTPMQMPGIHEWGKLVCGGFVVFLLTTFRLTRFLGEPERYVEIVGPVAAVFGVYALHARWGSHAMVALTAYCIAINMAQLVFTRRLAERLVTDDSELEHIQSVITQEFDQEPVRFCANDEQVTKRLMLAPWEFARIWSAEQQFAGCRVLEAVSEFPFLKQDVFEKALTLYKINACVLHKENFSTLFRNAADASRLKKLYESPHYLVYRIH